MNQSKATLEEYILSNIVNQTDDLIDMAYDTLEGCEDLMKYHERHGIPSLLILTQHDPRTAVQSVAAFKDKIIGKTVVEIGAGVGYLALEMARYATRVFAIEADPAWSWVFTRALYAHKPENLTWIFGTAESVADFIKADIAVVFTRSGIPGMKQVAAKMAPVVIMPLQEKAVGQAPRP